jgi:oligopeptide/dipeptide ABC transporter ATP-binding protein
MTANTGFDVRDATPDPLDPPPGSGGAQPRRPVLEIRDLSISYETGTGEVRAVRGVNLALAPGEVVGLAGESGCGKSTLAYGSMRLLRPPAVITAGSVTYHGARVGPGGVDVLAASQRGLRALRWREIAIVFQSAMNGLNPVLRVGDQLQDALEAHLDLTHEQRLERIVTLIELVGIPRSRLRGYPHELSGGMRQRVMIAMALAAEPEVVIMDEPTTGLDVVVQREILAEIFELKQRLGFSVLFITHDLSLLLEIAERVVIMYAGQVVEQGPTEQIRARPAHPYTRGLLGSFPRLRGERQQLLGIPGSPPDLRSDLTGCPFIPRCRFSADACREVDMRLIAVPRSEATHLSACPFVTPESVDPLAAAEASAATVAPPVAQSPEPPGPLVLEAVELSKTYRIARRGPALSAVHDVSFRLHRGAVVALVGESGSGKTTVAKLLAGQEQRSDGQVLLDGETIEPGARRAFRSYKSDVQMVFQDPFASLNPVHTVRYHLQRALRVHQRRTGRDANAVEIDKLLTQVRLAPPEHFRDAYPHELSGGQRQRVAIARALAASPRVLLADEPVSMLDVSIRLEVLDLIEELRSRLALAVLYITHDIASARYFADEILVMYAGEIVERGPAEQVTQHPAHPYTQLLVASAPDPDAFGAQLTRRPQRATAMLPASRGCRFAARCPFADERCLTQSPPLDPIVAGSQRAAACWRLDVAAPALITPGAEGKEQA